jgi:REP element-mobilizing transposase RayT
MLIWSLAQNIAAMRARNCLSAIAAIFAKVCNDFDCELTACDGEDDHVHLLVVYPPKVALAKLVNLLKGVSSRRLRELRPEYEAVIGVQFCGRRPTSLLRVAIRLSP